jgi:hypothetical protein
MSFRYRAFGLAVRSEIELPELDAGEDGKEDLTIRLVRRNSDEEAGVRSRITAAEVYTFPPHIGRCWIREGREIELEPIADVDDGVIRLFLLGTAFGVILHQRGFLVLHSSSVMIGGRAVAFVGASGLGKSTLAAAFDAAGYPVVADDIGALRLGGGEVEIMKGFRQIRLWPDSAAANGYDPARLPLLHSGGEKRWLRPTHDDLPDRLPVAAIFVLDRTTIESRTHCDIAVPGAQERILELVRHTFTFRMLSDISVAGDHFRQCAAVVRTVPVFHLSLPSGLDLLPESVRRVIEAIETGNPAAKKI